MLAQGISFLGGWVLARHLYPPATQDQMAGFLWLINTLTPLSTLRYDIGIVMPKTETSAQLVYQLSCLSAVGVATLAIPVVLVCALVT